MIRKLSSSLLAITANAADAAATIGPAGSIKWNYNNKTLHVYDGVTAGGRVTSFTSAAEEGPTPQFIEHSAATGTNGSTQSNSFSDLQLGDLIVLAFGRGNNAAYWTSPPTAPSGWTTLGSYSGSDSYNHDHGIFSHTVTTTDVSNGYVTFDPPDAGIQSYQASAWHAFQFRNVTAASNFKYYHRDNYSVVNNPSVVLYNATEVPEGSFLLFSHSNGTLNTLGATNAIADVGSDTTKYLYNMVNDTNDINLWTGVKAMDGTSWTNPTFSGSANSSSDSILMAVVIE